LPGCHLHQVGSYGPKYSHRDIDGVDDEEVRIDEEVSAYICHMTSPLLAELPHQSCPDRGDLAFVFFAEEGAPTSNGAASDPVVFLHGVTVTQDASRQAKGGLHSACVYPQAVYIFKISLVSRPDVVSIQTILDQEFPVGLDRVSIGTPDDPHAFFGLVDDEVQIFASARQIGRQFLDIGIEAHKNKPAIIVYPRRRLEAHLRSVEMVAVSRLIRHAYEIAMIIEGPGVVEALQNVSLSLIVPADERASVRACVQENPELAVIAAHEEKRSPRDISAPVFAGVFCFGFVTQIQPAFVEDPFLLPLKNLDGRHGGSMDPEDALFWVVYNQPFRVEHGMPLVDSVEPRTSQTNTLEQH